MSDEIFDPEIHSVDPKTNEPTLNKDGSFRKKRRDAGTKTPRAPRAASRPSAKGNPLQDQRARYVKAVNDTLAGPTVLLSLADPVDGFCAQHLGPMWAEVLADVAMEQPRLAAVLEKAAGAGVIAGAFGLAALTLVQFGHNHGKVPDQVVKMLGGTPRRDIEKILDQRGESLRRAADAPHNGGVMSDAA